jgi:type I restriction enzyme S subunit
MNAQQFLAEFGHISNARGGVGKLRELILELAIRGELLSSPTGSSDARMLLSEIGAFRAELVRTGKLRRPTPLPEIEDSELTFKIPENWTFERLGNVCEIVRGVTFPSSKKQTSRSSGLVACLRTSNVQAEIDWDDLIFIEPELVGREDQWVEKGDTMISMANSYELVGKVALVRDVKERATFGGFIAAVRPHVLEPDYLYLVLRSPYMQARMRGTASQTTNIANISLGGMRPIPTPIPPKEDQSRIVAKVDELMDLCDTLEARQKNRRKLQNNLRQSTLQATASATSPHELQTTWARLADNFGRLFHTPEDVADLRNLILDLAANGFLSEPQTDDGDPLTILGEAILQQKAEFSARELREINALPEVTHENGRLRIALGRIVKLISGQHLLPEEYNTRQDGIPYITGPAEFKDRRPSPAKWTTTRRAVARIGDVLITVKGSGVGKTALCDLEELAISRQLMAIRALANLDRRYLSICIDSAERSFQEQKFGIAIPGIGRDEVLALPILLPSVEEQGRIIHRVDELMRLCDSLELQLRSAQKIAGRLVIAAISSLTGVAIEQEEELMKAPQTELIASLRLGTAPGVKAQAPLATILARQNGEMSAKDLWQRFGGEIDAFYAQLKIEVAHGWVLEPAVAEIREKQSDTVSV